MAYSLATGISFALVDGHPVFMCVTEDCYFCLPPELEACFTGLISSSAQQDGRDEQSLVELGVLVTSGVQSGIRPCGHPLPTASLWTTDGRSRFAGGAVFQALFHLLVAALLLRLAGLARVMKIISWLKDRPRTLRPATGEKLASVVSGYRQAVLVTTTHDQCLRLSVAMTLQLVRLGYRPAWCFGVSGAPFSAHAWVEIEGTLLSDECEHVDRFTPVAVY